MLGKLNDFAQHEYSHIPSSCISVRMTATYCILCVSIIAKLVLILYTEIAVIQILLIGTTIFMCLIMQLQVGTVVYNSPACYVKRSSSFF